MADTPEHEQPKSDAKSEAKSDAKSDANSESKTETKAALSTLPAVESPSISPAVTEPVAEKAPEPLAELPPVVEAATVAPAPAAEAATNVVPLSLRLQLSPRQKRQALFAASVALAATLGAVLGSLLGGGLYAPQQVAVARVDSNQATQQTVAHLTKELAALKANVETANKTAHAQLTKLSDKLAERLAQPNVETTGSISAPQTVTPLPTPRPSIAAMDTAPVRLPVVADWSIRGVRDGYVYVQGHGELYQVAIGAPLPGLGTVEQVRRQDGRWLVVTPKGLIVSQRDRDYFE